MFRVKEYKLAGVFSGKVVSLTLEVTGEDMKLSDSALQDRATEEIINFKINHPELNGFYLLTEYSGWIAKNYRLMSYSVE